MHKNAMVKLASYKTSWFSIPKIPWFMFSVKYRPESEINFENGNFKIYEGGELIPFIK